MNNPFPKLAMARFSHETTKWIHDKPLTSMHGTNPQPFSQKELEETIGQSFNQILNNVNLGFSPDQGTLALRQTLADHLYESINSDDVITHAGAQEALFCSFYALLKAQDRVLVVAPVFEPLVQIPINIGCIIDYTHLNPQSDWALNLDEVESQFKLGCRLFVINFPHNPTGAMLSCEQLNKVVQLCEKYDVWLLSDEVFRGLEHKPELKLPAVADLYDKGISIGVISKAYAVPGLRIGWLVSRNKTLLERVMEIKGYLSICNSQVDELLASEILKKHKLLCQRHLKIILQNKILLKSLISILGHEINIIIPEVGCCVFALLKNTNQFNSESLVKYIAEKTQFLLYPSALFKTEIEGLRVGFGSNQFKDFVSLTQQ